MAYTRSKSTQAKGTSEAHRTIKKNFETQLWIDGHKLPLNHFVQETIGHVMTGILKTLKGIDASPDKIQVKIAKLHRQVLVDAHTYPSELLRRIGGRDVRAHPEVESSQGTWEPPAPRPIGIRQNVKTADWRLPANDRDLPVPKRRRPH